MDSGDDPVGYVMCAINAYSSVLVLPRSSWSTATHRLRPRACALLGQLAELAAASELAQLAGRCGAGVCACACGCLRACGLRVRLACVRVRAAWSSWCARACLRACGVHACGCGVGVRAAACVRSRACARVRALAVQLTTATLSATGIRKTCSGRVCRGSSWRFGSGRVGSLKVQVVKVLK